MTKQLHARRIEAGGETGFAYAPFTPELEAALPEWVRTRNVEDGEVIKPGAVFRWRDLLVKFTPRRDSLREHLRPNAAVRSIRIYERIFPIKSPRPVLAMSGDSGLLVTEYIEGEFIEKIWRTQPNSMDRLVEFLAAMHARRVFHGDFHAHNIIWDGSEWFLIDLEGVRHPLRVLLRRPLIEDHWARLHFCLHLSDDLEPYFRRYLELSELGWDPNSAWQRVTTRSSEFSAAWPLVDM